MLEHIKKNNEIMKQADGFYRLEKDKEAIALFLEEIEKNIPQFPYFPKSGQGKTPLPHKASIE